MPWYLFHYHPFHCPFPIWWTLHNPEELKPNIIAEKNHSALVGPLHERFPGTLMILCTCYLHAEYCASDFAIRFLLDVHKGTINWPVVECKRYIYGRPLSAWCLRWEWDIGQKNQLAVAGDWTQARRHCSLGWENVLWQCFREWSRGQMDLTLQAST